MPNFYGKNILLREYRSDDVNGVRSWTNDRESVRYLSARYWMPQSAADASDFVDHAMHAGANGAFFVIADPTDERYLGQIDLFSINWKLRSSEMGIVLGLEAQRGHGIGTEAIGLLLEYAFQTLGLERVELEVDTGNKRAIRCYEKAGFVLEGVKRHAFMVDGEYSDLAVMSVLAGEWRSRRASRAEA